MQEWVLLKKIYLYWYALEMISTHFANLAVQQQQQSIFAAQFWRTRAETWHQNTRDVTSWLLVATKNTPTWVKFMFSKKVTKIDEIFTASTLCSTCQIDGEDFVNFCGVLENTNFNNKWIQVNLFQKYLFMHSQYDKRLSIELPVQYVKIPSSILGGTCCEQKLFMTFRTIFVHNMFYPWKEELLTKIYL